MPYSEKKLGSKYSIAAGVVDLRSPGNTPSVVPGVFQSQREISNRMPLTLTVVSSLLALAVGLPSASLPPDTIVHTIAFGSCSKSHLPQPLWPVRNKQAAPAAGWRQ